MLFHTVGQSQVFLSMLYAGLAIGAWYDVLRFVRRVLEAGPWLTAALDLVFAVGAAATLVVAMVLSSYGEMRVYCLLGALSGAVIYSFTLSRLLRVLVCRPCAFLARQARKLISTPFAKKIFR